LKSATNLHGDISFLTFLSTFCGDRAYAPSSSDLAR
jgi:hypothetical protein